MTPESRNDLRLTAIVVVVSSKSRTRSSFAARKCARKRIARRLSVTVASSGATGSPGFASRFMRVSRGTSSAGIGTARWPRSVFDSTGAPIPLPEQDRSRWDPEAIAEGTAMLEGALGAGTPGPFQIEAAISALHCRARAAAETDWKQIAELYALLEQARPSPAVRVNRSFAVARAYGALDGLALLETDDVTGSA